MRKTRVLLLTQWFDPEPTFKGLLFARELVKRGFEVEVVTGFPNYPGGKVYPGYRIRTLQREVIDGVRVTRVALYPSHSPSVIARALNYLTFALSAMIYGMFFARRPDVVYSYHPPLTTGLAAVAIRFARRSRLLCDIQDMWPDTLRATGMISNRRLLGAISSACNWFYRQVDQIVVLSPGFKRLLESRGVPGSKIEVIYNWADEEALSKGAGQKAVELPPGNFRVLFAGNIGRAQSLGCVLQAAKILSDRGSRAQIILLGSGLEVEGLKVLKSSMGLINVHFLPAVPMSEVGAYLAAADALLVYLRPDELFRVTVPSKTQAYMAVGKPIVMGVEGDAADLVLRSASGVVVRPGCPESVAEGILRLESLSSTELAAMGARARAFYGDELSVSVGAGRFCALFEALARTAKRSTESESRAIP